MEIKLSIDVNLDLPSTVDEELPLGKVCCELSGSLLHFGCKTVQDIRMQDPTIPLHQCECNADRVHLRSPLPQKDSTRYYMIMTEEIYFQILYIDLRFLDRSDRCFLWCFDFAADFLGVLS